MKKKFTNKQRAKIYLKAAIFIFKENRFCCSALRSIGWEHNSELDLFDDFFDIFPEFKLFRPIGVSYEGRWWDGNANLGEDINPRVLALLFASEMALNP